MRDSGLLLRPARRKKTDPETKQIFFSLGITVGTILHFDLLLVVSSSCKSIDNETLSNLVESMGAKSAQVVTTNEGFDFVFCYRA